MFCVKRTVEECSSRAAFLKRSKMTPDSGQFQTIFYPISAI